MITMQKSELRKGPWIEEEDEQLAAAVAVLGDRRWDALARSSGLRRSGKSCRLRWLNYLRPDLKHGKILPEEEKIISELHEKWGNKWSKIAGRLPGRTDNEIKNYWRSHLRKKAIVKEEEYCSSSAANSSLLRSKSGTASTCLVHDDWSLLPKDDNSRPSDLDSCDAIEGFALTTSLHETRLTEWMPSRDDLYDPGLTFDEWSTNSSWFFSLWG